MSGDASDEGVQRDLLPIVEGSIVETKHGNVNTEHILFICSGAFSSVKPEHLMPELQGRLPIRVNLSPLNQAELRRVLTETEFNLILQQKELLKTEGVELEFSEGAIDELAKAAVEGNTSVDNIGARRLHTVIENVVEDISYKASSMPSGSKIVIDADFVVDRMKLYKDVTYSQEALMRYVF